jgi:archaeal flagellar protein FlaJ
MIEELERNVDTEIQMLREISDYSRRLDNATEEEKMLLEGAITSLMQGIKIINGSIPKILEDISLAKKLPTIPAKQKKTKEFERVNFQRIGQEVSVILERKDKDRFLKELSISEQFIRRLRRRKKVGEETYEEFRGSRGYLKIANLFFLNRATKVVKSGKFKELSLGIRKANIDVLFESYIAAMLFSVFLAAIVSVFIVVFLLFFDFSFTWPIIGFYEGSYLLRIGKIFWIAFIVPLVVFLGFYIYPSTEKKAIANKINEELPFVVIHMSAVSGSGIAPVEIFRIVGLNQEYPYVRKEIRKVLNQINLYGYDLVTALNNASKTAPSEKLSELFSGLSTTVTSGASLSEFLEKRAESLLLNYRLERERYTRVVETFLDIYISLVIAAPMIFLLLMIMMLISGIEVGISTFGLTLLSVGSIAILNMFFLVFLQVKQPSY